MSTIIGLVSTFRLPLHPSTSKSNPPLFLAPFGLSPASPPLQSPIPHSCSLLLDFLTSPRYLKVQSAALPHPFWTFSCLPALVNKK